MKPSVLAGVITFLVAISAAAVAAHHSPAAFDQTKQVTLTGIVKGFRWQNPHTWLEIDVKNDKGAIETWGVEMTSPTYLIRAGWTNKSVRPGDKVTILVHPVRDPDTKAGIFISVTLADGRTLSERPARLGGNAK